MYNNILCNLPYFNGNVYSFLPWNSLLHIIVIICIYILYELYMVALET